MPTLEVVDQPHAAPLGSAPPRAPCRERKRRPALRGIDSDFKTSVCSAGRHPRRLSQSERPMLSLPRQELKGHFTMLPMDEVHFGSGSLDNLSTELEKQGVNRAVIITGNTLAKNTNLVDKVAAAAGNKCAGVFHETSQHVPRRTVIAAAEYAREREADALISFGGGTPNDTAKATLICLAEGIAEPSDLDDYMIKVHLPGQGRDPLAKQRSDPNVRDPDHAVRRRVHLLRGRHRRGAQGQGPLRRPADHGEGGHPRSRSDDGDAGAALARHRDARGRSLHRGDVLQHQRSPLSMRWPTARSTCWCATCARPKRTPGDAAARAQCMVATWMSVCGLANVTLGLEPRHRPPAGRPAATCLTARPRR